MSDTAVLVVDCVAHIDEELGTAALKMMGRNVSAERPAAAECRG